MLFSLLMFFSMHATTLSPLFQDNAVLQQGMPVPVWGTGVPGEKITVSIAGKSASGIAGADSTWMVELPKLKPGGPHTLVVKGKTTLTYTNILVGEVWICSGQSNMAFETKQAKNYAEEKRNAAFDNIHFFTVQRCMKTEPFSDLLDSRWKKCTPQTAATFSAVGFFFGRDLHTERKVPVGLIHTSWGGTTIETWMSPQALQAFEKYKNNVTNEIKALTKDSVNAILAQNIETMRTKDKGLQDGKPLWADPSLDVLEWDTVTVPEDWEKAIMSTRDGVIWFRKDIEIDASCAGERFTLSLGPIDDTEEVYFNGVLIGYMYKGYTLPRFYPVDPELIRPGKNTLVLRIQDYNRSAGLWGKPEEIAMYNPYCSLALAGEWRYKIGVEFPTLPKPSGPNGYPASLFQGMINPLLPMAAAGVIWYQGESNASRALEYASLFPAMIQDWRNHFKNKNLPFLFVQLANYMKADEQPASSTWAELRESQTKALSLPKTGMAVAIDIGEADDIHPKNKQDVGKRLFLAAQKAAYNEKLVYSGPLYASHTINGKTVKVTFDHFGSGLKTKDDGNAVGGFALAGKDRIFYWANAEISGKETVKVSSEKVPEPVALRYGWANNPDKVNLYNKEGLPASPFRTDTWEQ